MDADIVVKRIHIGQGRSGVVFRVASEAGGTGDELAIKVFVGDTASKLVHYVFSGAPNPYTWNEDAIHCCRLRRQLMADLAELWFDGDLTVSNAVGWDWNDQSRAYELHTEFVDGRPAALCHPFSESHEREAQDLSDNVMKPLQKRLAESGFDGLVWQAGRGNPVAANNFLRSEIDDGRTWTWIDLESGVPALIPMNPLPLLSFYLPKSLKHRCALFDDVDVPRLRRYAEQHEKELAEALGPERLEEFRGRIDQLEEHQSLWKRMRRGHRSITYALKKQRITQEQADYFYKRVLFWYGREGFRIAKAAPRKALSLAGRGIKWIGALPVARFIGGMWLLATSQKYRDTIARSYVARRITKWENREQLTDREATFLHTHLTSEEASSYLTDFGMHIAIKPFVKGIEYGVILPLLLAGYFPPLLGVILIAGGGTMGRTAYTLYRLVHSTARRREKPWAALVTGLLPVIGNAAYPVQIVYSGTDHDGKLAQFIIYDTLTRFGEHFPIWGGADTATEHFFNRFGNMVARDREDVDKYFAAEHEEDQSADAPKADIEPATT